MSSLPVYIATEVPNSEPESLDSLDYDDWEGQFEFVGNSNPTLSRLPVAVTTSGSSTTGSFRSSSSVDNSQDDLNLSHYPFAAHPKRPILIDEETFLSIQPASEYGDAGDHEVLTSISGAPSGYFIENALKDLHFANGLANKEHSVAKHLANKQLENLNNIKNKLISTADLEELLSTKHNNNNNNNNNNNLHHQLDKSDVHNKMDNKFSAELHDNLAEQLELLQRQVETLTDSQNNNEDINNRTRAEYAVLKSKYHMLEEQLRDTELRYEERLSEEQKRCREQLERLEREAMIQNENCQIKISSMESEANSLRDEIHRLRGQCDKQNADLDITQQRLEDAIDNLAIAKEEVAEAKVNEYKYLTEKTAAEELMVELSKEVERIRSESGPALPTTSPEVFRLEELHHELDEMRRANKMLSEQNEEMQALMMTRGVEEGRSLLNGTTNNLASELGEMSERQLQIAYQDKEDENQRLKHYIDTILLNIVENYPQLLEVKSCNNRK